MRSFVASIALVFLAAPAAAEEWWEAETAHFIIKSRDSQENTREFAGELEQFDGALRTLQNMPLDEEAGPANKLTVYRFGNQTDIARLAGSSESGVAGFFISNAGASVAFVPARKKRSNSIKTRVRDEDGVERADRAAARIYAPSSCSSISRPPIPAGMSRVMPS